MRAGRAEGTARAARGATAWQTAARSSTPAACATEAGSPRAPATATATCWMNAGYAPKVPHVKRIACTWHRASSPHV